MNQWNPASRFWMLILIGAVPERLVHSDQSRPLLPSSLAPPGPAIGFSTATLIQGRLRSKMYSYIMEDGKGGMTAKGIKKNVIKKNIMHEDYKNTLLNEEQMRHKIRTIRSVKHKLQSFEINKISLSCFDDKCYIHDNGTSSYACGHYKIK